jgi:hypothetical protein
MVVINHKNKGKKMKAKFKHNVKTFHGINRREGIVYTLYNNGELLIAKNLPNREITEGNHNFGKITKNLHILFETVSTEYKRDLSIYALLLQSTHPTRGKIAIRAYGLFSRMMWKLKSQFPEIDLVTLTKEDILNQGYPSRTVAEAMKAGLLLEIEEGKMLDKEM